MAVNLRFITPDEAPQVAQQQPQAEAESALQTVGRIGAQLGSRALETGLGILTKGLGTPLMPSAPETFLRSLTGQPEQHPTEALRSLTAAATKGYTEPQSTAEEIAGMVASDVPILLATGGLSGLLPRLGRSAVSNVAIKGAEKAGAGPIGQLAVGGLAGAGFDFARLKGKPGALHKRATELSQQEYAKAESVAPKIQQEATGLRKFIFDLEKQADDFLAPSDFKRVQKNLEKVDSKINRDMISINDVWKLKKRFNNLAYRKGLQGYHPDERRYYKQIVGQLNTMLEDASNKHPEFGVPFNKAEGLHKAVNARTALTRMFEGEFPYSKYVTHPLAQLGLGLGLGWLKGPKYALLPLGRIFGRELLKGGELFVRSPQVRTWLNEMAQEAIAGDKGAVVNLMKNINTAAENFQQEEPQSMAEPQVQRIKI